MPTLAEVQLERLATDRRAYMQRLVDNASNPETAANLAEIRENSEGNGSPHQHFMAWVSDSVVRAVRAAPQAFEWQDIGQVCFSLLNEEDVVATTSFFADGSALVLVSDSLSSLLFHLASLSVAVRPRHPGQLRLPSEVACAVLRFHVLQQRLFGLAGKCRVLIDGRALDEAENLATCALHFVIAHESAHHLLDHGTNIASSLDEGIPLAIYDGNSIELEADVCAMELQRTTFTNEKGKIRQWYSLASALLAFMAIELVERSLFVRRAKTHPPSVARWQQIRDSAPAGAVTRTQHYLVPLMRICDEAGDVKRALPPKYWEGLRVHPGVSRDHRSGDYLKMIAEWDGIMTAPLERLYGLLEHHRASYGVDLVDGLSKRSSGAAAVLDSWGLPAAAVRELTNPVEALTFHRLHSQIRKAPALHGYASGDIRFIAAVAAARLLENDLERP